jgi:hypothetical protein
MNCKLCEQPITPSESHQGFCSKCYDELHDYWQ